MFSSRGSNGYGQQKPYSAQSSYAPQNLGAGGLPGGSHAEPEPGGYRPLGPGRHSAAIPSAMAPPSQHYGGQYGSVYGSATQQFLPRGTKASVTTALEGRSNYGSSIPSPSFAANAYVSSSSHGYGAKADQLYPERLSEYPSVDRNAYGDRRTAYMERDLSNETANRYAESVALPNEHQSKMYDRLEHASVLRQEEMIKARTLQSASVESSARQADYLAARASVRHPAQDPIAYGGRIDPKSRTLSLLSGTSYSGQHNASILGAAPQRTTDDLIYAQGSSNPGYGVSLPPGRDYGAGKGLHGTLRESDYPTTMLGPTSHLRIDDRKDERPTYGWELERRGKDRDYLRDRENEREREKDRLREREREREREHERERERERERAREREREREREKERARERERREKEKDRELKRGNEPKRGRTQPRVSRERRGPSLVKDVRSLRGESPRHDLLHRLHSPVKGKRREYECKVFSFSFVEAVRDYLSLDKRYPRLYLSPECSKVAVCWPRNKLKLSLHTPVSFEHEFVEEIAVESKGSPSLRPSADISKTGGQAIIWNAKIILMSGLSQNSQAELSSEKIYDDRIPHFGNLLRFAVLRKNNSLMAIGGPWNTVDGGDPSVDDSSLVRTALRYAKDVTNLDLENCRHWNRFLEIHYDRIGKDGLFSHKEVTVFFVPDLSECLPSLDSWREQWFNHKKAASERERLRAPRKEITGDKLDGPKDKKNPEHQKHATEKIELQKKKEAAPAGQSQDDSKKEKDTVVPKGQGDLTSEEAKGTVVENKDPSGSTDGKGVVVKEVQGENSDAQTAAEAKPGKRKIIKRIVKKIVAKKKEVSQIPSEQNDKEFTEGKNVGSEVDGQQDGSPSNSLPIKTFVRKRVVKKSMSSATKEESSTAVVKTDQEPMIIDDDTPAKPGDSNPAVQAGGSKIIVKKKVVRRVAKRKAPSEYNNSNKAEDGLKQEEKIVQPEDIKGKQTERDIEKQKSDIISSKEEEKEAGTNLVSALETDNIKQKVSESDNSVKLEGEELMDDNGRKERVETESRSKTNKSVKEKKKNEEPPRHTGCFLQTKRNKDLKLESLSLSLDSLLDYSNKDIEESAFEISLFGETFYEMLQYEMGCRLFTYLQKLRIKFVKKRNLEKRQREETSIKESNENSARKRVKADTSVDVKSMETEATDGIGKEDRSIIKDETSAAQEVDEAKMKNETVKEPVVDEPKIENDIKEELEVDKPRVDGPTMEHGIKEETKVGDPRMDAESEEEPEEDPEEDEEINEDILNEDKASADTVSEEHAQNEKDEEQHASKLASETIETLDIKPKVESTEVVLKEKETDGGADRELLQAFRFFDRNRVGYIRVEDLRLILHNLGKFLSHRHVKELVQSALLKSNTGRDDRILYDKLVKMVDI